MNNHLCKLVQFTTHTISPVFTKSSLGGFSEVEMMLKDHKIKAMLMNNESLATNRPIQSL